jgi:DNA-binding IclR family transcriptional regulator
LNRIAPVRSINTVVIGATVVIEQAWPYASAMVRSALSANRTLAILDWVVSHPGEKFTLSELSRASGINIPSLMAVLQSLTDAGYLSRSPVRKTYEAGPALLAIGLSVGAHNRAFELLPGELEQLAQAVGVECSATVAIGDQTMTVADAGRPGSYSLPMRVGDVPIRCRCASAAAFR